MYPAAIIFNADGTISETDEIHRTAFNLAFRDHDLGWQWSHGIYARMIDLLTPQEKITSFVSQFRPEEAFKLQDGTLLHDLIECKNAHYINLIETGSAMLRPGVSRLIQEARNSGIKLAIASLSRRRNFEVVLQNHFGLGALASFEAITTIEDIKATGCNTTDMRSIYVRTLDLLDVEATDTFAIEAREPGTEAARELNLNIIATPGLYTSSGRFKTADLVLSDLGHPAAPFQIIRGHAGPHHFVSVESLSAWRAELAGAA